VEFVKIWEIIVRRKWVVIGVFSVFIATIVVGTYVARPIYEARAKILIESSDTLSSLMSALGLTVPAVSRRPALSGEESYDTEIALTTIRPLLERLSSNLSLRDRDGEPLEADSLIASSISSRICNIILPQPHIKVEQLENTGILEIISNSTDPTEAATMSNELAKLYIDDRLGHIRKEYKAARLFIEEQVAEVKKKYLGSLLEKKDFMITEKAVDLPTETRNLLQYIQDLKREHEKNEIAIAQASENIVLIEEKIGDKAYVSASLVDQLESRLGDLLVDVAGKSVDFTEEHPGVAQLNRKIDAVEGILKDKASVLFGNEKIPVAPIYGDLISNLKDAYINKEIGEVKRSLLEQYIEKSEADLIELPAKSTRSSEIELSLTVYQSMYHTLLEYLTQVGVAESMTISNIKLIEPAIVPDEPEFPDEVLSYGLGIPLGLFLAISFALFREYVDNTIKRGEDFEDCGFTFLGSIPEFKKLKGRRLVSRTDPNDPVYEAYRKVLSSIHFVRLDAPSKSLLVSSIDPKEGSSTTAANLGILLAREGKKVLLVDADLRRPSLHRLFKCSNRIGLADLLLAKTDVERVISNSGIEGLSIVPSGPTPPDTSLLLKSNRMRDLIDNLAKEYDILLFDCAPLLVKNDAILLMSHVEDIVLVSRKDVSTRHAISRAEQLVKSAKITPIGIVLNCV
jgi:capsular exopolysaccharide synthesis family protein